MSTTVRHRLIAPTASGQRRGFHRLVDDVNLRLSNGYAFHGPFIPDGRQCDLPVGALVIRKTPVGSFKSARSTWAYALVDHAATPSGWEWSDEYDGHAQFLAFRDEVAALLDSQAAAQERVRQLLGSAGLNISFEQAQTLSLMLNEEREEA